MPSATPSDARPLAPAVQRVSDPARIRALAHPVRLDLLSLLGEEGELTATQCADRLDETVANCSFHLRTLAKAGFIEPATARGREKPWRVTATERTLDPDPDDPASERAVAEVAGLQMLREVERVKAFLEAPHVRNADWDDTVTVTSATFWATAEEMRDLVRQVHDLTSRFAGRRADPSLRPDGARIGRLFATVNPDEIPPAAENRP
ncbi:ArsR/SmtB family transcription factor [Cellulomonas marina]|uniref:Helix-turn-helix domain-containing protein n=1 Tax=Cellulomonas marina TaxID=988821 RepID=A0A1I0Y1Q4_9CELL|nr:helix-turn-helix domain-containing protein [Cellulomonas marina]GIG28447.1 transcriptional regulator [Cellulomonas marina]SFB06133.1 Helix-turn-helix domain-containing protein [Cellulomonas marina]